ncbi:MAG: hypothetical protein DMG11_24210 [Acidobacteria bacterium]|nr:MAG: hypothetical protein DMG11_24210 [Acidobacteriota bacterium]
MSKKDRQKVSILVVLLGVLGLTLVLAYRMNKPASTAAVQSPETKPAPSAQTATDAKIRLDELENQEAADAGRTNVFQYRETRGAPGSSVPGSSGIAPPPPPAPVVPTPAPGPIRPTVTQGFAVVSSPTPKLTAFLQDDSQRHFNVTVGEVLLGRYRIATITDTSIEIEDLQFNRRQVLPLQK